MARTIKLTFFGDKANEWAEMGLDSALSECIDGAEDRNVRPDGFEVEAGESFAVLNAYPAPDGTTYHVLFWTTFRNEWAPWTHDSTWATLYNASDPAESAEFAADVAKWEAKPETDPDYHGDDDSEDDAS